MDARQQPGAEPKCAGNRWLYCFYLDTTRTDAFLRTFGAMKADLGILDYTGLRALFRRFAFDAHSVRATRDAQTAGTARSRLRLFAPPGFLLRTPGPIRISLGAIQCLALSLFTALAVLVRPPDHACFYNGHPLFLPVFLACLIRRVRVVTDLGDILYLLDHPDGLAKRYEKWWLRHTSGTIICVSDRFRAWLVSQLGLPPEKICVLSAAVPESFPRLFSKEKNRVHRIRLRERLALPEEAIVLAYAGGSWLRRVPGRGLVDVQGTRELVEGFRKLVARDPRVHLVCIGFPEWARGVGEAAADPATGHFHHLGPYQSGDELHATVLGGADYLCLPSANTELYQYYDRFKTWEYLATGNPILADDIPLNRELIGPAGVFFNLSVGVPADLPNPPKIEVQRARTWHDCLEEIHSALGSTTSRVQSE